MNNETKPDEYLGRQGNSDIYIDNHSGLFYVIPIMNSREMRRLSNLELNKEEKKHV